MARGAWSAATIALAAALAGVLASVARGFAEDPNNATLNYLTVQRPVLGDDLKAVKLELNPYGLALINTSQGQLQQGSFLTTQWNDVKNNPGQGRTILQVTLTASITPFATIDPNNPKVKRACGTSGVGLTMALAILSKGFVLVGSTPVPVGGKVAGPGCLLVLDANGNLLDAHAANEPTSTPGVQTGGGPWAFAVQESNDGADVNLFVSYVLGTCRNCTKTQTGAQGGMVVRYRLKVPDGTTITPSFWGKAPDVIASGFPTQPGNIVAGAVGPTGLVLVKDRLYSDSDLLFIANNLNSSVGAVLNPGGCFTRPKTNPRQLCVNNAHVWGGLVEGPVGLALSPKDTIVGANRLVGTLFEFKAGASLNKQLANQLVDNTSPAVGAGALSNVLFLNEYQVVFTEKGFNNYFWLSSS